MSNFVFYTFIELICCYFTKYIIKHNCYNYIAYSSNCHQVYQSLRDFGVKVLKMMQHQKEIDHVQLMHQR